MKLVDTLAKRIVGRGRRGPTAEEVALEERHREAVASLRKATAEINGCRARTLDELRDRIDKANGMMRAALESRGDG